MSEWFNSITNAIGKIIVKSVVDSLGKLMLFVLALLVLAAIFVNERWVIIFIAIFAGLLLLVYLVSHFYCLINNPDLLRSEEYNIRKQIVEVLGDKDNLLPVDSKNIASIANPYSNEKYLERKEGTDE